MELKLFSDFCYGFRIPTLVYPVVQSACSDYLLVDNLAFQTFTLSGRSFVEKENLNPFRILFCGHFSL